MNKGAASSAISGRDYEAVLNVLSATGKGRAFLTAFLHRARPVETRALIDALRRLEEHVLAVRDEREPDAVAAEISRVAAALDAAAREPLPSARQLLDVAERCRSDLLAIVEGLRAGGLSVESPAFSEEAPRAEPPALRPSADDPAARNAASQDRLLFAEPPSGGCTDAAS